MDVKDVREVDAGAFIGLITAAIHLLPQITVDGSGRSGGNEAGFLEQPIHHLAGFADEGTLRRRFISAPSFAHGDDRAQRNNPSAYTFIFTALYVRSGNITAIDLISFVSLYACRSFLISPSDQINPKSHRVLGCFGSRSSGIKIGRVKSLCGRPTGGTLVR
jgi:hypothetical protein